MNQVREDDVPVITCLFWRYDVSYGHVVIQSKERRTQSLILDRPSSDLWLAIDGQKPVARLRELASAWAGFDMDGLLRELEGYGLISYRRWLEEEW
jgi:hypothetical protein